MISEAQLFGAREGSTLNKPVEHLMACHRRIEERLNTLERAGAVLESRREEALEAIGRAFAFMDSSGALHTRDEEDSVFPRIARQCAESDSAFLEHLEDDHEEADRAYAELKQIVASGAWERYGPVVERLTSIYRRHIAEEDARLMELGRKLSGEQLADIAKEMRSRRGML